MSNPAYSTLPFIVEHVLPHIKDVILMIPERSLPDFHALGFHELFLLESGEFEPRAKGLHYVVVRGFEERPMNKFVEKFVDLQYECSLLKGDTVPDRIEELAKAVPSVAICAIGGFPVVARNGLHWCGVEVRDVKAHVLEALGLSAVLTYANRKGHSLSALGQICVDRNEAWAYHWVTVTLVFAGHSPAVHLAFAHDTRFMLGWAVEKEYTGRLWGVFTASAPIHAWLKFTSKKDDLSFDAATRKAMAEAHKLLKEILP